MIKPALSFVKDTVNQFLGAPPEIAVLGNVAFAKDAGNENAGLANRLLLSIVNVEEDRISKDPLPYRYIEDVTYYSQPAVNLNLYLLFSANFDSYDDSLNSLSKIIEFFQYRPYFTADNATGFPVGIDRLIFDLYTLNLDQVHHLWSMLGGKYIPSVLYKMRMLIIKHVEEETPAVLIQKIKTTSNII